MQAQRRCDCGRCSVGFAANPGKESWLLDFSAGTTTGESGAQSIHMGIAFKITQGKSTIATNKTGHSRIDYSGAAKQIAFPVGTNFCRCRPCVKKNSYLPYPTVFYSSLYSPSPVPIHPKSASLPPKPYKAAGMQSHRLHHPPLLYHKKAAGLEPAARHLTKKATGFPQKPQGLTFLFQSTGFPNSLTL